MAWIQTAYHQPLLFLKYFFQAHTFYHFKHISYNLSQTSQILKLD